MVTNPYDLGNDLSVTAVARISMAAAPGNERAGQCAERSDAHPRAGGGAQPVRRRRPCAGGERADPGTGDAPADRRRGVQHRPQARAVPHPGAGGGADAGRPARAARHRGVLAGPRDGRRGADGRGRRRAVHRHCGPELPHHLHRARRRAHLQEAALPAGVKSCWELHYNQINWGILR